jgi:hypothetical protein
MAARVRSTRWGGVAALFATIALACGCSSNDGATTTNDAALTFEGAAIATTTATPSGWSISLRSSPATPTRGTNALELQVRDASGAPVHGLAIDVVPWMPAMAHGASLTPTTRETSDGTYVVSNVATVMPGSWELRITMTTEDGSAVDHATLTISIA